MGTIQFELTDSSRVVRDQAQLRLPDSVHLDDVSVKKEVKDKTVRSHS